MRKKFLAVALSCSMVFSLAACGNNNTNNASSDDVETSADASGDTAEAVEFEKPEETVTGLAFTLKEQQDLEKMGGTILTTISEYFALYVTGNNRKKN